MVYYFLSEHKFSNSMKNTYKFLIILLIVVLSYACGSKKDSDSGVKDRETIQTIDTDKVNIDFKKIKLSKSYKSKSSEDDDSTYITLQYVEMISGPNKDEINSFIHNELIRNTYTTGNSANKSLQDILNSFINDYKEFIVESPDYAFNWFYEISVNDIYYTHKILCLEFSHGGYTGGAHGNSYVKYVNIDFRNASQLKLNDLLIKDFKLGLNKLIEKKFREVKGLLPTDDLEQGGLFENKIAYNENFAVLKDGLLFYYNNYEIAPYAAGPTELLIKYDELGNLIPEYSLLREKQ